MLRYSIVFTVKHLKMNVVSAIIFKCMPYHLPSIAAIMVKQTLNILKNKYFRLTFFYYSSKFTE